MIRILSSREANALLTRRTARMSAAEKTVRPILEDVRKRGDVALKEYGKKFDGLDRKSIRITEKEIENAGRRLTPELRTAVEVAAKNVRRFAEKQIPREWSANLSAGLKVGQLVRPLETIGAYIPAGRYPLVSTVIMTCVPALVAGVKNICIACPKAVDEMLGTAYLLGVTNIFQIGGAQAIAAFAYGTKTVPRADRIVGPGNKYVAAAKKLLAGEVGIDFVAGPTEILIIAAEGNAKFLAADMLAQAEHDTDASAIMLTTSKRLATQVAREIEKQLVGLPTAAIAREAIAKNSAIVIVPTLAEAVQISNKFAPEHLSLQDEELLPGIRHAGSIFIGPSSPEAAGDYATGPNHVLPTNGAARLRGGLSAADYVKLISTQQLDASALRKLAPSITTLARAEGLEAHARSVEVRLGN